MSGFVRDAFPILVRTGIYVLIEDAPFDIQILVQINDVTLVPNNERTDFLPEGRINVAVAKSRIVVELTATRTRGGCHGFLFL